MAKLGGVRRLPPGNRLATPASPAAPLPPAPRPITQVDSPAGPGASCLVALPRAGDGFAYVAAGVDRRAVKELEGGGRRPEATLDLHGRKAAQAEATLVAFVRASLVAGRRVIHVVHGRGRGSGEAGPVLRQLVIARLSTPPLAGHVLALVAAPPPLGGPGAALVWLRKG